jgi:tRNA U34 5-methylaminomethyl-2-thiouridine-forming methyltransferase MnmC
MDIISFMEELYNLEKRSKKIKKVSQDGTITLYSEEFGECYHSLKDGALKESLKKHIEVAFELQKEKKELNILDICFGLGYNTLGTLLFLKSKNLGKKIKIYAPEFDKELVKSLKTFPYPKEFESLKEIIFALSSTGVYDDGEVFIQILFEDARQALKKINTEIDIIYQDPFSPKKNPLLWTREYFEMLYKISSKDAILTTYSVATSIRLGLWESGFLVYENIQDEVRRGTIASKRVLENFKEVDLKLKLQRNPNAKSLKDSDFLES